VCQIKTIIVIITAPFCRERGTCSVTSA
jgi:hypothetical protein